MPRFLIAKVKIVGVDLLAELQDVRLRLAEHSVREKAIAGMKHVAPKSRRVSFREAAKPGIAPVRDREIAGSNPAFPIAHQGVYSGLDPAERRLPADAKLARDKPSQKNDALKKFEERRVVDAAWSARV